MSARLFKIDDWIAYPDLIQCGSSRMRQELFELVQKQHDFAPAYAVGDLVMFDLATKAKPLRLETDKARTSPIYRWAKENCTGGWSLRFINRVALFENFNDALAFHFTWC